MTSGPFKIFVVEDNELYNRLLVHTLSLNPDFEIKSFFSAKEFISHLHENPDVVTLDYRLPDSNGIELLQKIKNNNQETEVIIISEQDEIKTAVELLKAGAYDYIVKSKDIRDLLLNTINNIRKHTHLKARFNHLQKEVEKKYDFRKNIIGNSQAIKKTFVLLEKAINTNITVMIAGETGTGKELVAKAIHYNSPRANNPFIAVNVSAIPSELIESELFGHEKGSFTGASSRRIGKFEEAHGGTLFLDEIGEMDISFQPKLLRALQEKEVVRVGSNKPVPVDCRIIVATNKNLLEEVKKDKFREDLYYRVFGLPIELPPLRERDKDVLILAKYFIEGFCRENELEVKSIASEAQKKLLSYSFPGNIRELKSIVELAVVLSDSTEIGQGDIVLSTSDALPEVLSEELSLREYNRRIVATYLKKYDNNISTVADKLSISQSTIYRMLKGENALESNGAENV